MVMSRAAFGVRGNRLPSAISWLLTVGWETVLTTLATLATARCSSRLGGGGGPGRLRGGRAGVAPPPAPPAGPGFRLSWRRRPVITAVPAVLTAFSVFL